jgi:hypothetical protein
MVRFIYLFFSSIAITLTILASVNYAVDPLAHFRLSNSLFFSTERQIKARLADARSFEGLLLGSSKVTVIQPELAFPDQAVLNGAFGGARPEEILRFLQSHPLDIRWLGIGFDLFMFNEEFSPYLDGDDATVSYSTPHYLLSIDTFMYSLATLYRRYQGNMVPQFTDLGAVNPALKAGQDCSVEQCDYGRAIEKLKKTHFSDNFELSLRRIEDLAKIAEWASAHKIPIVVWLNPLNRSVSKLIKQEFSAEMRLVQAALIEHFGYVLDFTESYPDDRYYGKTDPFHFQAKVGTEMASRCIAPIIMKLLQSMPPANLPCPVRR